MGRQLLEPSFFASSALRVAPRLLGKHVVVAHDGIERALVILEVEAYQGTRDRASHAWRGRTPRNAPMFGPPGHWYVYLVYGVHWMLNVTTDVEGTPSAVLLRGTAEVEGPGRLTRRLGIDGRISGQPALPDSGLWLEDRGVRVSPRGVRRTPRIGVDYAGAWASKPYRYVVSVPDLTSPCE